MVLSGSKEPRQPVVGSAITIKVDIQATGAVKASEKFDERNSSRRILDTTEVSAWKNRWFP